MSLILRFSWLSGTPPISTTVGPCSRFRFRPLLVSSSGVQSSSFSSVVGSCVLMMASMMGLGCLSPLVMLYLYVGRSDMAVGRVAGWLLIVVDVVRLSPRLFGVVCCVWCPLEGFVVFGLGPYVLCWVLCWCVVYCCSDRRRPFSLSPHNMDSDEGNP